MFIPIIISGFGGGMVRGLIGYVKHQYSYKNVGFKLPYFLVMSFISGVVGTLCATAVKELGMGFLGGTVTSPMAFIIGYAGGDIIENVYKIIMKTPSLYSFPENKKDEE